LGEGAGSVACRTWHMSVGGTTRLMERVPRTQCTKNCHSLPLILLDYHCERSLGGGAPKEFTGPGALGRLLPSLASVHYHHSYVHRSSVRVSASTGTVRSNRSCLRCPSWKFFLLLLSVTQTRALYTPVNPLLYTGMTTRGPPPCMS
jgi:hypothetical protein